MTKYMPHYMRRYRVRAGLTQGEMSHLLGSDSQPTIAHYEVLRREPDLRSALAYQVVFGVPLEELFPGIYDHVEQEVTKRAAELRGRLGEGNGTPGAWHKRKTLRAISRPKADTAQITVCPQKASENHGFSQSHHSCPVSPMSSSTDHGSRSIGVSNG